MLVCEKGNMTKGGVIHKVSGGGVNPGILLAAVTVVETKKRNFGDFEASGSGGIES